MAAFDVLARAAKELGYSRWNDPKTGTKYGRWYAEKTGAPWFGTNGVPYCAMFVSYILDECGVSVPGFPTASCLVAYSGAKRDGCLVNIHDAKPGDIVLFDWDAWKGDGADHVGFVERNCGSYLQTIEGNTSPGNSGSQGNGGGVYRRTRSFGVVYAIIRPDYNGAAQKATAATIGAKTATQSHTGGKALEVDGLWGSSTTRRLQEVLGAPYCDGVISRQNSYNRKYLAGCTSGWEWTPGGELPGSQTIAKLQEMVGAYPDGFIGYDTNNALIRYFKRESGATVEDGRLDAPSITIKAMQRWLNSKD